MKSKFPVTLFVLILLTSNLQSNSIENDIITSDTNHMSVIELSENISQGSSDVSKIEVYNGFIYSAEGFDCLRIYDSDNTNFTLVSHYDCGQYVTDFVISNNLVFLAAGTDGILVIDVSNPADPSLLSQISTLNDVSSIEKKGSYLFATAQLTFAYITEIIDVTDVMLPVGITTINNNGFYLSTKLTDNYFFTFDYSSARIYDVWNESQPIFLSTFDPTSYVYDSFYSDPYLFVPIANKIDVYSLINASDPVFVRDITAAISNIRAIEVYPGSIEVAGSGLQIFDYPSLDSITSLQVISLLYPTNTLQRNTTSTNFKYLGHGVDGLSLIDSVQEVGFEEVYHLDYPSAFHQEIKKYNGHLFIESLNEGVFIFDIMSPYNLVGQIPFAHNIEGFEFFGNYLFISGGPDGLFSYDITSLASIAQIDSYDTAGTAAGLALKDSKLIVSDGWAGIQIFDISDGTFNFESSFSVAGGNRAVHSFSNLLTVSKGMNGFELYNISDFTNITSYGSLPASNYVDTIDLMGDTLIVSDRSQGFDLYDLSDLNNISLIDELTTVFPVQDLVHSDDVVIVLTNSNIQVFDISNTTFVQNIGQYDFVLPYEFASHLEIAGNKIFASYLSLGTLVFTVNNTIIPEPVSPVTSVITEISNNTVTQTTTITITEQTPYLFYSLICGIMILTLIHRRK